MKNIIKYIITALDNRFRPHDRFFNQDDLVPLPTTLWAFIWHFMRPMKWTIIGFGLMQGLAAVLISVLFWYVGELVKEAHYTSAMLWLGGAILFGRFFISVISEGFIHFVYNPYYANMIRYQLYRHTAQQSLTFFQNDFAGRLANKIQQTGRSIRDIIRSLVGSLWFAISMNVANLYFLTNTNLVLALPLAVWIVSYVLTLAYFTPKLRHYSHVSSNDFSVFLGQLVDSLTNALPVKYFARTQYEDGRVRSLLQQHSHSYRKATGTIWAMNFIITTLNTGLLVTTALIGYDMVQEQGQLGLAAMAMALPMMVQVTFQSGWIMYEVSGVFENLGVVQEGVDALTKRPNVTDTADAKTLDLGHLPPAIAYDNVTFHYDPQADTTLPPVLKNFYLSIPAGQKLGLVGRSGAGKSTVSSLVMRTHNLTSGQILINGNDIRDVAQESLRSQITVVTQDSYLFHRSILENIQYGRLDTTLDEVIAAAKKAHAHDFILKLEDNSGRKGYQAHIGERGVKLSGGQKQRIAIARAILKDSPILILDEATSALDSESEQAIQNALADIMQHKTVIAVAHRLSTLRQMDRIIVLEGGRIIEDGTHNALVRRKDGHYAKLWHMQSGGFLNDEVD
ncbi:MAG: ABC transporter ATP-binding protein [Pseudomonadota bacterium]